MSFWYTHENIPEGIGFSQFDAWHLFWIVLTLVCCALFGWLYRKAGDQSRGRFRIGIAAALFLDELFKILPLLAMGTFTANYLPLHLCSINIFLIAAHAIRPGKLKEELLYSLCLPAAAIALIFPSWTRLLPLNFLNIHSSLAHLLLVLYPVMLLSAGEIRPDLRRLPQCLLVLVASAAVMYPVNKWLATNFMFLNGPGTGNPLVWFETWLGTPGYLLGMPVLLAFVWAGMYLPIYWSRRQKAKKG